MEVLKGVRGVKKGHKLRILCSLYGLKQSARDWNYLMNAMLLEWGFIQSSADPCLYVHTKRSIRLLVYVDDITAATKTTDQLDWFFKKLSGRFTVKNLREISKILGVRVTRNRTNRTIDLD